MQFVNFEATDGDRNWTRYGILWLGVMRVYVRAVTDRRTMRMVPAVREFRARREDSRRTLPAPFPSPQPAQTAQCTGAFTRLISSHLISSELN